MERAERTGKKRVRASVACTFCRSKRSKCDGIPGTQACSQCVSRQSQCEMSSGKRNRGHYKPQVEALTSCVQLLEKALASAQQSNRDGTAGSNAADQWHGAISHPSVWSNPGPLDSSEVPGGVSAYFDQSSTHLSTSQSNPPGSDTSAPLLSPPFSQQSPILGANMASNSHLKPVPLALERNSAYLHMLRLSPPVIDYLLGLFFHRYQLMLQFVCQHEFMAQKAVGHGPAFRPSLMLAMMAAGLRYSTRKEVTEAYVRPDGENVLATAAKRALEPELRNCSNTTVQSLLILSEVETGTGNDMTGYLYSSMASKLIFDLSLDLGSSANMVLSDDEVDRRYWLVWAASVRDQYWAVALRRPLAIKSHTLQVARLAARFARNGSIDPHAPSFSSFEHQVNESLLDIMELAGEVTDSLYGSNLHQRETDVHTVVSKLNARLDQWFTRLPEKTRRGPVSGEDSYHFLFVLHLIFNAAKIVLHQDTARGTESLDQTGGVSRAMLNPAVAESRSICATSATQIAKFFEIFRRREDIRTLQCIGVQWATIAMNAFVQHIIVIPVEEAIEAVAHLQSLSRTLKEMSKSFQSALQPYEDSCRNVNLFWSRLNRDDTSGHEILSSSAALIPETLIFSNASETGDAPHRLETTKGSEALSALNGYFHPLPDMINTNAVPTTGRNQVPSILRADSITYTHQSPLGPAPVSGSWSDSWEWEDILSQ